MAASLQRFIGRSVPSGIPRFSQTEEVHPAIPTGKVYRQRAALAAGARVDVPPTRLDSPNRQSTTYDRSLHNAGTPPPGSQQVVLEIKSESQSQSRNGIEALHGDMFETDVEGIDESVSEVQVKDSQQGNDTDLLDGGYGQANQDDLKSEEEDGQHQQHGQYSGSGSEGDTEDGSNPSEDEDLGEQDNDPTISASAHQNRLQHKSARGYHFDDAINGRRSRSRVAGDGERFFGPQQSQYEARLLDRPLSQHDSYPPSTNGDADEEMTEELIRPDAREGEQQPPNILSQDQWQTSIRARPQSKPHSKSRHKQPKSGKPRKQNSSHTAAASKANKQQEAGPSNLNNSNKRKHPDLGPRQHKHGQLPKSKGNTADHRGAEVPLSPQTDSSADSASTSLIASPPSLDYPLSTLSTLPYSTLKAQPFDENPSATSPAPPIFPLGFASASLPERLAMLSAYAPEAQRQFFAGLTIDEWDDCGEWFVSRFGELVRKMGEARREKRRLARAFEDEVHLRMDEVERRRAGIEDALRGMKRGGLDVLRGGGSGGGGGGGGGAA
ncbi:MAG: hypothetical protein M1819_003227 [Sarea resinae]|nr:MAG: hypothetical protein M1819_003227 [Sarea resinae]